MYEFLKTIDTKVAALTTAQATLREKLTSQEATSEDQETAFEALREAAANIVATPHF